MEGQTLYGHLKVEFVTEPVDWYSVIAGAHSSA